MDVTENRFIFISPSIEKLTGYTADESIKTTMAEILSTESFKHAEAGIMRTLPQYLENPDEVETYTNKLEIKRKDGSMVWTEIFIRYHQNIKNQHIEIIGVCHDISAIKQTEKTIQIYTDKVELLQEQLREQEIYDPLTRLYNQRFLEETLEREIANANREKRPLSLLVIDIDHLKKINDTYGQQAGDLVLKRTAQFLEFNSRKGDILCRYQGAEFIVVMPGASIQEANNRADIWRKALQHSPVQFSGILISFTISVGVSSLTNRHTSGDILIELAGHALHQAKQTGRNMVVSFKPSIN